MATEALVQVPTSPSPALPMYRKLPYRLSEADAPGKAEQLKDSLRQFPKVPWDVDVDAHHGIIRHWLDDVFRQDLSPTSGKKQPRQHIAPDTMQVIRARKAKLRVALQAASRLTTQRRRTALAAWVRAKVSVGQAPASQAEVEAMFDGTGETLARPYWCPRLRSDKRGPPAPTAPPGAAGPRRLSAAHPG